MDYANHSLGAEPWIWYGICNIVIICRYTSQLILRRSLWKLQLDDWLMLFLIGTFTIVIVEVYLYTILQTEADLSTSRDDLENVTKSIVVLYLLLETAMVTTLWGVKACFLIAYYRIMSLLSHSKLIKVVAIYCAFGYIAVITGLYGGFCRPFSDYFALVPGNDQCHTWVNYNIFQFVLNSTSDLLVLFIPTSLVLTSKMKWQKKAMLCCVFSLGIFVVICSSFTKYYAFTSATTTTWFIWYIREAGTAMLVGNIFLCLPLLKKLYGLILDVSTRNERSDSTQVGSMELPIFEKVALQPPTTSEDGLDLSILH